MVRRNQLDGLNLDEILKNKSSGPRLSVIIPCYNEEANIGRISQELIPEMEKLGCSYEIIIVDDGSSDRTAELAAGLAVLPQIKIVTHEKNKGLGEAIKSGFKNSSGELAVTLDADFSFRPELIHHLMERFKKGDVDLVIGSPKLANHHEELNLFAWFVSKAARLVYRVLFLKPVTSVNQILRLYKTECVKNMRIDARGFDVFAEILFRLIVLENRKYAEIPAAMVAREHGASKLNYKLEMWRHLKLIMKILKWQLKIFFEGNK